VRREQGGSKIEERRGEEKSMMLEKDLEELITRKDADPRKRYGLGNVELDKIEYSYILRSHYFHCTDEGKRMRKKTKSKSDCAI